ncbi:DUF262 domain-containing protein [Photorhabdus temperata]|uniref:DUF262 domain-containing protein n=1 Tax=Photorhabdus temperata TaxID=574560 RepID=UPI000389DDF8|nr:DUF262 domain-containing protein [Photorhabdus temperata]EQB99865.1 hypothetical protein B738_14677 [Photorhabdus temperata subsp. temperata M1021]
MLWSRLNDKKNGISTTHPISDIRDWNGAGTLILQPDYQRREVWGIAAKIMLIDSIMNAIPMPKIFVSSYIQNGKTVRAVIDGQQRITAILGFLNNEFPLDEPYSGKYNGLYFQQLPENIQDNVILAYDIDFNEAKGLSDADLREVYSRVNKYLVALNKQELRKADYPGDFLNVCEAMANHDYFDEAGVFTAAARRRSLDVEFTSELVGALVIGVSERKDAIDSCYQKYSVWDYQERDALKNEFEVILNDISNIFPTDVLPIRKTRWKQKADFYSLFMAVSQLRKEGFSLPDNTDSLRSDLELIGSLIAPTSNVDILSKYAVYCVSQANSAASRRWRTKFLKGILRGTYARNIDDIEQREVIFNLAVDIRWASEECFPLNTETCRVCGHSESGVMVAEAAIVWPIKSEVFQLSNLEWAHRKCVDNADDIIAILPEEFGYFDDMDEE